MNFISLSQLNSIVKQTLSLNLEPAYWVVAEIGELRVDRSGHCYIELVEKEQDRLIAKTRATIWSATYRKVSHYFETVTGQSLRQGMKVLLMGTINFHEIYGLSFNIKEIDPNYTLGERARRRQEIIDRLKEDGVFKMNHETEFPLVPQNIAIISSPTAAGFGDFMDQINNNPFGYKYSTRLYTATMQGENAPESIIQALSRIFNNIENYEIVVIIRGGGAQIDLDCFDHYELAAHVAQFPIPVVTGIGHERDETIVDLVAHTRLKTPTAVAEFLIHRARVFEENIEQVVNLIAKYARGILEAQNLKIQSFSRRFHAATTLILSKNQNQLNNLLEKIRTSPIKCVEKKHEQLKHIQEALIRNKEAILVKEKNRINLLENTIKLLNPVNVLNRGYTITYCNNNLLKDKRNLQQGDQLVTITNSEVINSTIQKIEQK